ncbi:hypothetical protein DsansV1_C01g0008811 [Dioscorea sansibarensis]
MFYACQADFEQESYEWYLDSDLNNHMTSDNQDIFVKVNASNKSHVKMANGSLVQTRGRGTIARYQSQSSCMPSVFLSQFMHKPSKIHLGAA